MSTRPRPGPSGGTSYQNHQNFNGDFDQSHQNFNGDFDVIDCYCNIVYAYGMLPTGGMVKLLFFNEPVAKQAPLASGPNCHPIGCQWDLLLLAAHCGFLRSALPSLKPHLNSGAPTLLSSFLTHARTYYIFYIHWCCVTMPCVTWSACSLVTSHAIIANKLMSTRPDVIYEICVTRHADVELRSR